MDTDSERAAYIKGLRALADVLEQTDDLPLPFDGHLDPITFHFLGTADPRAELAEQSPVTGPNESSIRGTPLTSTSAASCTA
jgi:hypothetical protein